MHRDAVAAALADAVDRALRRADRQGRAFVQQLLPGAGAAAANDGGGRTQRAAAATATTAGTATEAANAATTRRDRAGGDRNLVRVDARARTLDAFVAFRQNGGSGGGGSGAGTAAAAGGGTEEEEGGAPQRPKPAVPSILAAPARRRGAREENAYSGAPLFAEGDPLLSAGLLPTSSSSAASAAAAAAAATTDVFRPRPNPHPSSRLRSVSRLLSCVDSQSHPGIEESLRSAAFVGMTDRCRALVQAGAALLLLDLRPLVKDLAKQQALRRVDSHVVARISSSEGNLPSVAELVELALLEEKAGEEGNGENGGDDGGSGDNVSPSSADRIAEAASLASRLLVLKREPLREHFGVEVTPEGRLAALPEVIDGLAWRPSRLPKLVLSLARDVDFSSGESRFFESVAEALAASVSLPGWSEEEEEDEEEEEEGDAEEGKEERCGTKEQQEGESSFLDRPPTRTLERCVAHVLLPAMRVHLRPPRARASDGSVVELTRLQSLYKIFERC